MLIALSKRLRATETFEAAIATILDDVIALLGAEYGNVQLSADGDLVIAAQRGFKEAFLKTFKRVKKGDGCACGRALRLQKPVMVRDVREDPEFATFLTDARAAGFRAVQSTPLLTSDQLLLGVVSTHFTNVHELTTIEFNALQLYSTVASDHAFQLLGNGDLAVKAAQMNDALYATAESSP